MHTYALTKINIIHQPMFQLKTDSSSDFVLIGITGSSLSYMRHTKWDGFSQESLQNCLLTCLYTVCSQRWRTDYRDVSMFIMNFIVYTTSQHLYTTWRCVCTLKQLEFFIILPLDHPMSLKPEACWSGRRYRNYVRNSFS